MNNSGISRRQLAKGAAWATPIIAASAVVPAYAASNLEYGFSASWSAKFTYQSDSTCSTTGSRLTSFQFGTDKAYNSYSAGFTITPLNGSPDATATLTNWKFQVALPAGMINSLAVTSGAYRAELPQRNQYIIDGYYDIFTFTWIGATTGPTLQPGIPWTNSPMTTAVSFSTACLPFSILTSDHYFARLQGTYSTDNGISANVPADWQYTTWA